MQNVITKREEILRVIILRNSHEEQERGVLHFVLKVTCLAELRGTALHLSSIKRQISVVNPSQPSGQNEAMTSRPLSIFLLLSLLLAANAASVTSIIESLKTNAVQRCGSGCDKSFIRSTFNYLLFACKTGGCKKNFVLRVTALGKSSHIQEYCVLREKFHSPKWAMRIQADLVPSGARIVVVAVPFGTRTEKEKFKRPYVLGQLIPRSQLHLVNSIVKKFCGVTV